MASAFEIVEKFQELLEKGRAAVHHITHDLTHLPAWINDEAGNFIHDKQRLADALLNFFRQTEATPQHTMSYQGALGGTLETFSYIQAYNEAKDSLKQSIKNYLANIQYRDTDVIRKILANAGYPGIKLKQVYRHVMCIKTHPRRISFSRIKHNSHRKVSKSEALAMLHSVGEGLHIDVQERKLNQWQGELVICRETPAIWVANISSFKDESNRSSVNKMITALPIVYLHNEEKPSPLIIYGKESKKRKPRSDKLIEDTVFLPSIHAYRYLRTEKKPIKKS